MWMFTIFPWLNVILSCFKQLSLNIFTLAEILNNSVYRLLQNDLCQLNNLNEMFSVFLNSFSASKFFYLFEVIFLLRRDSLPSKPVLVIKFVWANLAAKVLNFGEVIYLSWLWLVSFFSISLIFCHNLFF